VIGEVGGREAVQPVAERPRSHDLIHRAGVREGFVRGDDGAVGPQGEGQRISWMTGKHDLHPLVPDHEASRHSALVTTDLGAQHVHARGLENLLHEVEDWDDGAGRAVEHAGQPICLVERKVEAEPSRAGVVLQQHHRLRLSVGTRPDVDHTHDGHRRAPTRRDLSRREASRSMATRQMWKLLRCWWYGWQHEESFVAAGWAAASWH